MEDCSASEQRLFCTLSHAQNIALGLFGIKQNFEIVMSPMKEMSISVQLSNNTTLLVEEISFLPPAEFVVH